MSGAAQIDEMGENTLQATGTDGAVNLKAVAAERLALHRNRRAAMAAHEAEQEARTRQQHEARRQAVRSDQRRGASLVRDAVKARYERRESYREYLAAEAERAISQAQAEADVAARNARAVTAAQMQLLEELDRLNQPEPGPREEAMAQMKAEARGELAHALADIVLGAEELICEPPLLTVMEGGPKPTRVMPSSHGKEPAIREISTAGLTVRLYEDIAPASQKMGEVHARFGAQTAGMTDADDSEAALYALEEEIAFRRAPEFPVSLIETQAIPGNLLEFPRELVAARRARPRLAEGPLREETEPQLRIFEVDAVQVEPEPEVEDVQAVPDWQSILLEGPDIQRALVAEAAQAHITLPPQTAPLERRLMSAAVDAAAVGVTWLGAVAVVAEICGPALREMALPTAAGLAIGSLAFFWLMYQVLFFMFADATPGMRWARIALCTFGDANPTRRAMQRRILATVLAACPLGLGLAWVWMDNDGMGWHDRMSRMYQRAY